MCGRFVVSYTYDELKEFLENRYSIFDLDPTIEVPRYNIGPGQQVLSIISDGTRYRVGEFKWGFVPFFAKDEKIGYKMINARSETILERNSFKSSFKNKRCIILADGFYEWEKVGNVKKPKLYYLKKKEMFAFAGLWSTYKKPDGTKLHTCTIITTAANQLVGQIHERMPVILDQQQAEAWLSNTDDTVLLQSYWNHMMQT